VIHYLLLGITYAFAAAIQPGVFQTYLISQTIQKGWQRTLPAAFAPLISDGPIIVLVVIALSSIPPKFIHILQCVGGLFLFYLTFHAWKSWRNFNAEAVLHPRSSQQSVLEAVFVNFLNPNPYLSWSLVMGPLLIQGWREAPLHGIALFVGFYAILILGCMGIIVLFGSARKFGPQVTRVMLGLSAIALLCFGLYQLWSGINNLWW
jgi:threonine/homoserine/homoserine lactone efflux protein